MTNSYNSKDFKINEKFNFDNRHFEISFVKKFQYISYEENSRKPPLVNITSGDKSVPKKSFGP